MCGIFAISGKNTFAGKEVMEGLKKLEYRGYDSWGIAVRTPKTVVIEKKVGKISEAIDDFAEGVEAIGHSRWATHGGVTEANAHPHKSGKVTVVHNGIFENFSEYKEIFEKNGRIFLSQTDTEVIAHLIETAILDGKNPKDAIRLTVEKIHGRFAILVMIDGEEGIYCARRGSPLIIGRNTDETYIASDIPAFLSKTQTVNYLDDNEMAFVHGASVEFFSIETGESIEKRNVEVPWKVESAEKGEYNHFMIKEIFDQKSSVASAINHTDEEIEKAAEILRSGNGVFLIACGTAHKACTAAEYFFADISGRKINVVPASEMPSFERFVNEKTVLFAVSQSGETADVLEILERGQKKGAKILSITNVESSSIARISDVHLPLRAGIEKAVASTKALTSQMALLMLLAFADDGRLNEGKILLQSVASSVNDLLNPRYEERVKAVAEKVAKTENIFIIGRKTLFPMSIESAIKIMEVSYIHAQGFAAGEMKHGPIALISEGVPCIVLGDDPETVSNATELKSRGAYIIGISPTKSAIFDDWLKVPEVGLAQAIVSILPVQILAYHLAVLRGCNPDMPRNLAKSVTVK